VGRARRHACCSLLLGQARVHMPTWKIAVGPVLAGAGFVLLERQSIVGWSLIGAGLVSLGFVVFERRLRVALPRLRDHVHMAFLIATAVAVAYDISHLRRPLADRPAIQTVRAEEDRLRQLLAACEAAMARANVPMPMDSSAPMRPTR
jgi:hypothetical protein